MGKKVVIFTISTLAIIGWGTFLYKEIITSPSTVTQTTTTQASMLNTQPMKHNTATVSAAEADSIVNESKVSMNIESSRQDTVDLNEEEIKQDQNKQRMNKINSMVKNAIKSDSEKIEKISIVRKRLEEKIALLNGKQTELEDRLDKLSHIDKVMDTKSTGLNIYEDNIDKEDVKEYSQTNEAIREFNKSNGKEVASVDKVGEELKLSIKGKELLIIDHKSPRVSQKQAIAFASVMNSFKKLPRKINSTRIYASTDTPTERVRVLKNYLRRQYGLDAKVITTSATTANADLPIQISGSLN